MGRRPVLLGSCATRPHISRRVPVEPVCVAVVLDWRDAAGKASVCGGSMLWLGRARRRDLSQAMPLTVPGRQLCGLRGRWWELLRINRGRWPEIRRSQRNAIWISGWWLLNWRYGFAVRAGERRQSIVSSARKGGCNAEKKNASRQKCFWKQEKKGWEMQE